MLTIIFGLLFPPKKYQPNITINETSKVCDNINVVVERNQSCDCSNMPQPKPKGLDVVRVEVGCGVGIYYPITLNNDTYDLECYLYEAWNLTECKFWIKGNITIFDAKGSSMLPFMSNGTMGILSQSDIHNSDIVSTSYGTMHFIKLMNSTHAVLKGYNNCFQDEPVPLENITGVVNVIFPHGAEIIKVIK